MSENSMNSTEEIVLTVEMSDSISAQAAEAWAVGQRGGVDVAETDPTYHNNAKYYAEQCADAEQAAQDAEGAAEQAESAKTAAEAARDRAEAIGAGAVQSATAAAESAQAAATAKTGAETAQSAAAGSATAAEGAAGRASQSATAAGQSATAAGTAKTAAEAARDAAAGSAAAAGQSAQAAAASAQAAEDVAESIPEDYSQLSDDVSGLKSAFEQLNDNVITESAGPSPIVSIADGADGMPMRSVEVAIEPVQDLHGYDHPWPAGGGKNLINMSDTVLSSNAYLFNGDISLPSGSYVFSVTKDDGITSTSDVSIAVTMSNGNNATVSRASSGNRIVESFTASESVVSMRIYAVAGTYSKAQLESGTTATAYSPYSNICPISGWTGAKVMRCGKNLLAKPFSYFSAVPNSLDECFFLKAGTYTLSVDSFTGATSWRYGIRLKDASGNDLNELKYRPKQGMSWNTNTMLWLDGANHTLTTIPITLVEDCYVRIVFGIGDTSASTVANGAMLSIGSAALPYEPYQGQTYEVAFPSETGTVYGGTLDVIKGTLTVDRAIVDLGTLNWSYGQMVGQPYYRFQATISNSSNPKHTDSQAPDMICSAYQTLSINDYKIVDKSISANSTSAPYILYVRDDSYTDTQAFKTAVSGVMLCYKSAEPIATIQLTPTEIKTLLGINNIWSDAGNTSIIYPADTKMYIDRKITEAVANALNA